MTPRNAARRAMRLTLAFDLLMSLLAMLAATTIVWMIKGSHLPFPWFSFGVSGLLFTLAAGLGFGLRNVPKQVWRHLGRPDTIAILQAIGLTVLLYLPVMLALNGRLYAPVTTMTLGVFLFTVLVFAGRAYALERSTDKPLQFFRKVSSDRQSIVLVGDDISCNNVLKRLQETDEAEKLNVLGIIETADAHPGRSIRGISVMGGLAQLDEVLEILSLRYGKSPWIAVTGDGHARETMLQAIAAASNRHTQVMALGRDAAAHKLEPVRPADLLARPERHLDPQPVRGLLNQARVLVTGGGGTIGAELTRQAAEAAPAEIAVIDASEFNLYSIDLALSERAPQLKRSVHLGDVRERTRMQQVFDEIRPDLVIHAAALKHVPLMERNVCEAVLTNVLGAMHAAELAVASGAKRLVFISTDKAVDPDNVMGATKRLAEVAISRIAAGTSLAVSIVRFGNVLGSSGSVVPLFERQITNGGPVTLTDPEATRYFMTLEEASSLVLQAAALQAKPGETGLFVLDMGEPIKIGQLAESMIRLKGLVPGRDIEIVTLGLREGEKMHEALTYDDEELMATPVAGVRQVLPREHVSEFFDKRIVELIEAARARNPSEARRLLAVLVPEYNPGARSAARRIA